MGKLSRVALYSETALLKKRRAAATLFSMSVSSRLELLEVGIGLQVGVGLGERKELAQAGGELSFRGSLGGGAGCGYGGIAQPDDVLQRCLLVGGVAFHGLDQIGHEIVTLFQLDVDIGECLTGALAQADEAIVGGDQPDHEKADDTQNDPCGRGHFAVSSRG